CSESGTVLRSRPLWWRRSEAVLGERDGVAEPTVVGETKGSRARRAGRCCGADPCGGDGAKPWSEGGTVSRARTLWRRRREAVLGERDGVAESTVVVETKRSRARRAGARQRATACQKRCGKKRHGAGVVGRGRPPLGRRPAPGDRPTDETESPDANAC